ARIILHRRRCSCTNVGDETGESRSSDALPRRRPQGTAHGLTTIGGGAGDDVVIDSLGADRDQLDLVHERRVTRNGTSRTGTLSELGGCDDQSLTALSHTEHSVG